MRFCKDCLNYSPEDNLEFDKCNYLPVFEPVRGTQKVKYCDIQRDIYGSCGIDAINFVARLDDVNSV